MNVRDRYYPTVPAYVCRRRRSCGIFNPNANPRFARLLRIIKYLAVPRSPVSCCKYLLFPLCHGRGREFESRRPRHLFKHLQQTQKKIWVRLGPISLRSTPPAAHSLEQILERALQHQLWNESCFVHRQQTARQDSIHEFPLCQTFALRHCLKILVRHMEIAVTQVVADCSRFATSIPATHLSVPDASATP